MWEGREQDISVFHRLSQMVALGIFCGERKQYFRNLGHRGKWPISDFCVTSACWLSLRTREYFSLLIALF